MGIKKALITGASRGIGRELARILASEGVACIEVTRSSCDLATEAGIQKACQIIEEEAPDLVVNNAGSGFYGPVLDADDLVTLNCKAVVALTQCAIRVWQDRRTTGMVLNVSSVLAFFPIPLAAVYGATKSFVKEFSKAADYELKESRIRVLCACPGQVATDFQVRATGGNFTKKQPGGLILAPEYVAQRIWQQIKKQKQFQIIDWRYALLIWMGKLCPASWIMYLLARVMRKRTRG